jgi:uncharacterized membrane protein YccC
MQRLGRLPLQPRDPGLVSLRRAGRGALVISVMFIVALRITRDTNAILFLIFGLFSLLILADFGGPPRRRAAAYLIVTAVGAALVAVATLLSPWPWLAALLMLLVAFGVTFAGVFGGYVGPAQPVLLLSTVLATSVPGPPASIGARLAGWLLAGVVATIAALLLWPVRTHALLHQRAATALRALAVLIEAGRGSQDDGRLSAAERAAREATAELRRAYTAAPNRPAGPTRGDRALAELVIELERALELAIQAPADRAATHPRIPESDLLASAVTRTLQAGAAVLEGGDPPDLQALDQARRAHRRALDEWAAALLRRGTPTEVVLAGLDHEQYLRVVSYVALALGANAVVTAGRPLDDRALGVPAGTPRRAGAGGVLVRIGRTVRLHLRPGSSVLHNSLRVAIGLALAVLLARVLNVNRGFWVVLATSSVLRSNALATGRTAVQAIAGTAVGFLIGAAFMLAVGTQQAILYFALPVSIFLAAYTPSAISFLVGQAAFSINLIVFFNLLSPAGWRVGLVRIEDVLLGTAIGVGAGLLLWPRGARADFRSALAALYRAAAVYVDESFDGVLSLNGAAPGPNRRPAVEARDLAGEAFDVLLNERAQKPDPPERRAALLAAGSHAILIADLLNVVADMGYQAAGCPGGARVVRQQKQMVVSSLRALADRLASRVEVPLQRASNTELRAAEMECLGRWGGDPTRGKGPAAIAVVAAADWVRRLDNLVADLAEPVADVARASRAPVSPAE